MIEKYELWEPVYGEYKILTPVSEISEPCALKTEEEICVVGLPADTDLEKLTELVAPVIENYQENTDDCFTIFDDECQQIMKEALESKGYAIEFSDPFDPSVPDGTVLFCDVTKIFSRAEAQDSVRTYSYCCCSNWKTIDDYEYTSEAVEVEEGVSLDQWNGRNMTLHGKCDLTHGLLHKIITINGEPVENMVLLHRWSQYGHDHPYGEILDLDEWNEMWKEEFNSEEDWSWDVME